MKARATDSIALALAKEKGYTIAEYVCTIDGMNTYIADTEHADDAIIGRPEFIVVKKGNASFADYDLNRRIRDKISDD